MMLEPHKGVPIAIELPQRVTLEIVETEPVVKGQTASSSYKPAMLSNGVRTMVPPHIPAGTRVVIMTEDGSYVERRRTAASLLRKGERERVGRGGPALGEPQQTLRGRRFQSSACPFSCLEGEHFHDERS